MKAKRFIAGLIVGAVIWLLVSGSTAQASGPINKEFSFSGGGGQTQMWVNFDLQTTFIPNDVMGYICCLNWWPYLSYGTWTCTTQDDTFRKWNCSGTEIDPSDTLYLTFRNTSKCLEIDRDQNGNRLWGWGARPSGSSSQIEPAGSTCSVGGIFELPEIAANSEALATQVPNNEQTETSNKAGSRWIWVFAVLAWAGLAGIIGFGALRFRSRKP